jgi:hypothetical protein
VTSSSIRRTIAYGELIANVDYQPSNIYAAYRFEGHRGDNVTITVTPTSQGTADVWLLAIDSTAALASATGAPATITYQLPGNGNYVIAIREDSLSPATFDLQLRGERAAPPSKFAPPESLVGVDLPVLLSCSLQESHSCLDLPLATAQKSFRGLVQVRIQPDAPEGPTGRAAMWIADVEQLPGAPLDSEQEYAFEMLNDFGADTLGLVVHEDATRYARTNDVDEGLGTLTVEVLNAHQISLAYAIPAVSLPTSCSDGSPTTAEASMTCSGTSP